MGLVFSDLFENYIANSVAFIKIEYFCLLFNEKEFITAYGTFVLF